MVAVVLFLLGGLFSVYEGLHRIQNPQPIENPLLILGIIVLSILLEGSALRVALKESNTTVKNMLSTIKDSSSTHILVVLIEDTGALIGLVILTLGLLLSVFVNPIFDGIAALLIGTLLIGLSSVLFIELKKLLIGESLDRGTIKQIKNLIKAESNVLIHLNAVRSMFVGSNEVLLIISMNVKDDATGHEIEQDIKELKNKIQTMLKQHKMQIYVDVFEF